jgi:hypothetical protein
VVRLYRDQGRSLEDVGAVFGRGPDWAKARVQAAGLTIRPAGTRFTGLDLEQLRRWRVDDRLAIAEIAARAGRPAATIAENLRKAAITIPPRRAERPALDPAVLRRLYVKEHRTLTQVAAQLCVSGPRVRSALLAAGIPLRPARRRADRPPLPPLTARSSPTCTSTAGSEAAGVASHGGSWFFVPTLVIPVRQPHHSGGLADTNGPAELTVHLRSAAAARAVGGGRTAAVPASTLRRSAPSIRSPVPSCPALLPLPTNIAKPRHCVTMRVLSAIWWRGMCCPGC